MKNVSRVGVYEIGSIFEHIDFAFREQPIEDYGIDAIIERKNIKSTERQIDRCSNKKWFF